MKNYVIAGFEIDSCERAEEHRLADRQLLVPILGDVDPGPDDFIPLTPEQARAVAEATGLPLLPDELEYFLEIERI
ncbi:hypothetical protein [Vulgatibacter sp.]|uniref:hypothetical protein n=1 Tax=Vulgatibacter sp. TaxID=1971226 RepID=UPI0035646E50